VGAGTLNGNTNNVNVTFDGGDVSVAGGSITCNAFTVTDNGAAPDTALTMTGTGSVTANGNMIIQAPTSLVDGNLQTSGTFTVTDTAPFNGSVTGTGTGGVRVIGGANLSTINGNVTLANGAFDVDGNLTVGATYTLQITGAGAFTVDGTTSITGTVTTANAASTFTGNVDSSGTFNVGGTGNVTFSGTYGALTSTGTVALLNTGSILFTGAADFTGGTLTGSLGGNPTIEFRGNVIFGTFTHNNDVVLFSGGTTPQTFNSNGQILFTTNIIKSAGANIVRLTGNLTITDANLNINTGTLDLNGFTLTVNDTTAAAGDITIGAAGTLDASVAGGHITIQGDWSN
jgi:cytoskeletal protein CcmA (bactofilin family)